MIRLIIILIVGALSVGCAGMSREGDRNSLGEADAKLVAGEYAGARVLYADFVSANPKAAYSSTDANLPSSPIS